jgi:predicted PolB exonuclease-like 3'-5' exonuclease
MSHFIAWDIETCPQELDALSEPQQRRYEKELRRHMENNAEADEQDASRLVRATHGFLCWVCCISAVRYDASKGEWGEPQSFVTDDPGGEADVLDDFWSAAGQFPGLVRWITFNGKRFDVPVLRARTLASGRSLGRRDLLNTYPYGHKPHADLATVFKYVSLEDVCDLLGVESPKDAMDGSEVYPAVQDGRIAEVADYCERDARATLQCFLQSQSAFFS